MIKSTGDIISWAWDFSDGSTSTEFSPTYTYSEPGSYDVLLSTTTADGCQSSFSITINLDEANFHGNSAVAARAVPSSHLMGYYMQASLEGHLVFGCLFFWSGFWKR